MKQCILRLLTHWHTLTLILQPDLYYICHIFILCRITDITSSVLVGQGEPAHLECAVDANPLSENTIFWERKGYDMATRTKTEMGVHPSSMLSSSLNTNRWVVLEFCPQEGDDCPVQSCIELQFNSSKCNWITFYNYKVVFHVRNQNILFLRPIIKFNFSVDESLKRKNWWHKPFRL